MRRVFVVLAVLTALLLPTRQAEAISAGGCYWSSTLEYDVPLMPLTQPGMNGLSFRMFMDLDCVGVNTASFLLVGDGWGTGFCGFESSQATLFDDGNQAVAHLTWVRVGAVGMMSILVDMPWASLQYNVAGPLTWMYGGAADVCVLAPADSANMFGAGPEAGP